MYAFTLLVLFFQTASTQLVVLNVTYTDLYDYAAAQISASATASTADPGSTATTIPADLPPIPVAPLRDGSGNMAPDFPGAETLGGGVGLIALSTEAADQSPHLSQGGPPSIYDRQHGWKVHHGPAKVPVCEVDGSCTVDTQEVQTSSLPEGTAAVEHHDDSHLKGARLLILPERNELPTKSLQPRFVPSGNDDCKFDYSCSVTLDATAVESYPETIQTLQTSYILESAPSTESRGLKRVGSVSPYILPRHGEATVIPTDPSAAAVQPTPEPTPGTFNHIPDSLWMVAGWDIRLLPDYWYCKVRTYLQRPVRCPPENESALACMIRKHCKDSIEKTEAIRQAYKDGKTAAPQLEKRALGVKPLPTGAACHRLVANLGRQGAAKICESGRNGSRPYRTSPGLKKNSTAD